MNAEVGRVVLKNRNDFTCLVSCFEICMSSKLYKFINNCQMACTYHRIPESALLLPVKEKQSLE